MAANKSSALLILRAIVCNDPTGTAVAVPVGSLQTMALTTAVPVGSLQTMALSGYQQGW